MAPEISVIIPTYNRAIAGASVQSALEQSNVDFEVIVVDDGSTDGSCEQLQQSFGKNPRFRMIRIDHRGPAAARNAGVNLSSGRWVAFLDSDDLWAPDKLARQVEFTRTHPEFRISQCQEIWFRGGRRVNPGFRHIKREGDIFLDSLRTCLISPSAVILEAALFRSVGGFDQDLIAAEDYDLWLRILVDNHVGLLDEMLVTRRAHREQLSATTPAMDRYRGLALMKLLASHRLSAERRAAVVVVLVEKCRILAKGARRRDRTSEAKLYESVAKSASRWRNSPDDSLLSANIEMRELVRRQQVTGDITLHDAR